MMEFLREYGYPDFPVWYRRGAPFTTDFGIDTTTYKQLRIHPATDRGEGFIWCPFDMRKSIFHQDMGSFGSVLRLFPDDADFEIRIAHLEIVNITPDVWEILKSGGSIKSKELIGYTGKAGKATGRHTHTEIVSLYEESYIIEFILRNLYDGAIDRKEEGGNLNTKHFDEFKKQYKDLNIFQLNKFLCRRVDYLTQKPCTFYNSKLVFNGL